MNVLIIGGLGFIGSNLALELIDKGVKVKILDDLSKCNLQNYLELKSLCDITIGSICSGYILDKLMKDIDIVYNLASPQMNDCEKDSLQCYKTNILGLQYLLEKILKYSVKKLIFASTTSLYRGSGKAISEDEMIFSQDNYTLSKIIAENMIVESLTNSNVDFCIFRNAPVYGERQFLGDNGSGITMKIINSLYTNNLLKIFSFGKSKKEFLYVKDLVHYYYMALEKGKGIYNLSNDNSISIIEVIKELQHITNKSGNIKYCEEGIIYNRSFSNKKLKEEFGTFNFTSLNTGLSATLEWYKSLF